MTDIEQDRPLRADARRNRDKLLAVAVDALARSNGEVPLDAIAKQAGVGIGTLYRHFPTREALVEAAYRHEVDRVCAAALELQSTMPPDVALREWMQRFVEYVATKKGMMAVLQSVIGAESPTLFARTYRQLVEALTALLDAAVAAGTIRADADAEDVLRALRGCWLVAGEQEPGQAQRLLELLMDGLRYGAPGPRLGS